jgi:hypothetical protein
MSTYFIVKIDVQKITYNNSMIMWYLKIRWPVRAQAMIEDGYSKTYLSVLDISNVHM